MKNGDLVELSSYGKKLLCLDSFKGLIGLVCAAESLYIFWPEKNSYFYHNRKEIKKMKGA
jgi:hypothetical protein